MKYLMKFKNEDEYQSYLNMGLRPHIALINNGYSLKYEEYTPKLNINVNVGDVAYVNANETEVNFVSLDEFSKMVHPRNAIGVVVIPNNFLPDGKARIMSLYNMVYNDVERIIWDETGDYYIDTPVPNHNVLPLTDNAGSSLVGTDYYGYLPSDRTDTDEWVNGPQSYVDPLTKYYKSLNTFIPSPYLSDGSFNPAYAVEIKGGNIMSDFNGLSNTQLLVNEGTQYHAAHACWNYKDATNGANGLQWYLPAMGELGFLMPRFELINNTLQGLSDMGLPSSVMDGRDSFWSSSELFDNKTYRLYYLYTHVGLVGNYNKDNSIFVRSFARV